MSDIQSKPATKEYRDGYERTFGPKPEPGEERKCSVCGARMRLCACCDASRDAHSAYHCPVCQPGLR